MILEGTYHIRPHWARVGTRPRISQEPGLSRMKVSPTFLHFRTLAPFFFNPLIILFIIASLVAMLLFLLSQILARSLKATRRTENRHICNKRGLSGKGSKYSIYAFGSASCASKVSRIGSNSSLADNPYRAVHQACCQGLHPLNCLFGFAPCRNKSATICTSRPLNQTGAAVGAQA